MSGNTVAIREGRLVEVRIGVGYRNEAEVDTMFEAIAAEVRKRPPGSGPLVTVADWRRCALLDERAADRLVKKIASNNPLLTRSAALLPTNSPVAALQFRRMLRETNFEDRRAFTDPAALISWLSEVLTPREQERLRAFLEES